MANHLAIMAVCKSVLALLETQAKLVDFTPQLQFQPYLARDFAEKPIGAGVSLFLYRVFVNTAYRSPAGKINHEGRRKQAQFPVDLHFLLTAWGNEPSLQHAIAGWMMQIMAEHPIIAAHDLNTEEKRVFSDNEEVEIVIGELDNEMMVRIWDMLLDSKYQLSVPYIARNVRIESAEYIQEGPPVQDRIFGYH